MLGSSWGTCTGRVSSTIDDEVVIEAVYASPLLFPRRWGDSGEETPVKICRF
jgi:hypothetical protein